MKKRLYENYDLEEAYKKELQADITKKARKRYEQENPLHMPDYEEQWEKQQRTLEEWELERLLKEGKVECLYRTATTKSKNVKSNTTLLEAQVYPTFKDKKDVPAKEKKGETRQAQKRLNDKNARRYLIRLACINFAKGDIWATFGWNNEHLPKNLDGAKKDIKNFIRRINYHRKKVGLENVKYICILAVDDTVRPHFHILMSGDGIDRDELEELWTKCERKNTRRIKPDDNFLILGLTTYVSNNPHGTKRWYSSKNLKKPDAPTRSYSKFKKTRVEKMAKDHEELKEQMEKAYTGFKFLDAEVKYNGINAAFYIYARMVRN